MLDNQRHSSRLIGGIYRIGQVITTGQMLTAYTAYNRNTNDVVGLSVIEIPPTIPMNAAQQFLQPIEKRRSINSPHVIHVHSWGLDGNRIYIATDPPRGLTLQHITDNENIDFQRALDLVRQLVFGLKTLHEQGIGGLDLRPQLITVDTVGVTDRVQIDDIGLRTLLRSFGYIGSQRNDDIGYLDPRYAPPEYINNEPIGTWSDLYQVGILLFNLITGRLPFVGRTPAETGILQNNSPVPPMSQFKYDTPASIQQLVEQALAKDPIRRFASAEAFLTALDTVQLPRHMAPTEQVPAIKDTKPINSVDLARAMGHREDDIALRETIIQPHDPTPVVRTQNEPTTTAAYAYLCYEKSSTETLRFPITQKSTIVGRLDPKRHVTPDLDLSEPDTTMTVSRQHARIRFEETFFYIEDLKSRNKTRLGELVLTPFKAELLQHGDTIYFGSVRTYFEIPGMGPRPKNKDRRVI